MYLESNTNKVHEWFVKLCPNVWNHAHIIELSNGDTMVSLMCETLKLQNQGIEEEFFSVHLFESKVHDRIKARLVDVLKAWGEKMELALRIYTEPNLFVTGE
jgi:methionine-rich copper-binding protein CopC